MFIGSALLLSLIGIVFIYSASAYWSEVHYADSTPFYVKQMINLALALACFTVVSRSKWLLDEKWWRLLYVLSILLLIAVLIPGIGVWRNGSRSWIGLGPLTFQPAELAKITTLVYLSKVEGALEVDGAEGAATGATIESAPEATSTQDGE